MIKVTVLVETADPHLQVLGLPYVNAADSPEMLVIFYQTHPIRQCSS